eukprot:167765-Alexandrium_andersonii.AAC.1
MPPSSIRSPVDRVPLRCKQRRARRSPRFTCRTRTFGSPMSSRNQVPRARRAQGGKQSLRAHGQSSACPTVHYGSLRFVM